MASTNLTVRNLSKTYGKFIALAPTDIEVANGEFLTLLGPSGSGKTTLLSLIAGLTQPDTGQVFIGADEVTHRAPYDRDIGVVFQNYALFPHMTVLDNIAFPLRMRKVGSAEADKRAREALEMVHLPHVAARYPKELSGGQQQRIALARCMVYRPGIILMDEPLGALDKKLREHMQLEIKRLHRETGTTIIYVTHDQEEAMTMSDRICLMDSGQIAQLGSPAELYFRPKSLFVADFIGESNLIAATVQGRTGDEIEARIGDRTGRALANGIDFADGSVVRLMVRPQNVIVGGSNSDGTASGIPARVTDVMVTGSLTKVYMQPVADGLDALVAAYPTRGDDVKPQQGDILNVSWQAADAVALHQNGAAR